MRNKLTMKKTLIPLLTAFIVPSALFSCGRDVALDSPITDTSETTEASETTETTIPETEEITTEPITEETTSGHKDDGIDFIKTVESTYICGQQLSYPLTWGQFGENFTVVSEESNTYKNMVSANVKYKGNFLGRFIFGGCDSVDEINDDTIISSIDISHEDNDKFDVPKIEVNGVGFGADYAQLFEALDNHYHEGANYNQIVSGNNDGRFMFHLGLHDDTLYSIGLFFFYK